MVIITGGFGAVFAHSPQVYSVFPVIYLVKTTRKNGLLEQLGIVQLQ